MRSYITHIDRSDGEAANYLPRQAEIVFWRDSGRLSTGDGETLGGRKLALLSELSSMAPNAHTHAFTDITNLTTTLNGKANTVHTHAIADTTLLQTTLDGKAPLVHTHAIADTTGLQTALDNKQAAAAMLTRQAAAPVTLTDAATIATNAALGCKFEVVLGANRILGNPTNPMDGQRMVWELIQDATGGRAITLDTKFTYGPATPSIPLSIGPAARDFLVIYYRATTDRFNVVGFVKAEGSLSGTTGGVAGLSGIVEPNTVVTGSAIGQIYTQMDPSNTFVIRDWTFAGVPGANTGWN